jgi:hypothetical protein
MAKTDADRQQDRAARQRRTAYGRTVPYLSTQTAPDDRVSSTPDATTVELSFEISGWLARVLEWRYRSIISQYVATEARSLKARCEAACTH